MYVTLFKTLLDFALAFLALALLSPVFILVVIALFIANNGRPFFTQPRPGKNSKVFKVIKFKTMNDAANAAGKLLPDAKRLTAIGKFVRSTSLDEIPQLLNVLKGDMSLVGPRPLLVKYLDRYTVRQARRHEVKPGITGWAQVNGRNAISWDTKFELDVYYVENISLKLDLKILWRTVLKVIKRADISSAGAATATEFKGTNIK